MRRLVAMAIVPLLLAVALVGFNVQRADAAAQAAQAAQASSARSEVCLLVVILCFPTSGSSPSASPTPSAAASASATPTPAASSAAVPTAPPGTPATGSTASAGSAASAGAATASPSPTGASATSARPRGATAASGLVVSNVTWTMTVGSATLDGFTYKGNVDLPQAGGGSVEMMEFTVSSMSMSNAETRIQENGVTGIETDGSFAASGVTMYATQLSGSLLGVPVTFTPSSLTVANLSLLKLPTGTLQLTNLITSSVSLPMTNVTADQAVILAGQAQKTTVGVSD